MTNSDEDAKIAYQTLTRDLSRKLDVLWDMETQDPDDYLTLCMLATHPCTNLRAVTVTPGTLDQVGLVRKTLQKLGRESIPIGARNQKATQDSISAFHYKVEKWETSEPDGSAADIIYQTIQQFPELTIITGGPVGNLALALQQYPDLVIHRWVAQGGFAGDNIVPEEHRMHKFRGKQECPTWNFGGDSKSAKYLLSSSRILERICVSKNVCHGVVYNLDFHRVVQASVRDNNAPLGLKQVYKAMSIYLQKKGQKALHDPLAACVAIDPSICTLALVELYEADVKRNGWGSRASAAPNTLISVSVNQQRFKELFCMITQPDPDF